MFMDNGQYNIPSTERSVDSELIQEIESAFDPRDVQEMEHLVSSYEIVKDIEKRLENYRMNATEATLPKQTALERASAALARITNNTPPSLHDRLIEVESVVGVQHLKKQPGIVGHRFSYHEGEYDKEGDWIYEVEDTVGTMVARYQFVDGQAHKLVDGKPVYFAEGEVNSLHAMIFAYHDQVYAALYRDDLAA